MSDRSVIRDEGEFSEATTVRGRWERENPRTDDTRFRHYVRVHGVRLRVPWILWVMFS